MGRKRSVFAFFRAALLAALSVAVWSGPVRADDALASLRSDFQRQTDPVKRAKQFPKLGSALLAQMRKLIQERDLDGVPALLTEYRDGAAAAFTGLEASGRDAGKNSAGYRELEIHLRHSLHVVNDVIFALPVDERDQLRGTQRELEQLDQKLVKALFPTKPEGAKTPPSSFAPHPER